MPACQSCQRPLATGRPSCLYCGAPIPAELLAASPLPAAAAATASPQAPAPARSLLVVEPGGSSPELLAATIGCSRYEAALLAKRGGLHLLRVLEPVAAESEAARLRAAGLATVVVPEAELCVRPLQALLGERRPELLVLQAEGAWLELRPGELLLLVTGPITRQRQASLERRKVDTLQLVPGWRVHLHRIGDPRPIEIDPENFEPGFAVSGSTRLEIEAWLAEFAAHVPRDDGFRDQPPALSPTEPEPKSRLSSLGALSALAHPSPGDRRQAAATDPSKPGQPPALLDNLKQFRFYSAWHAAVERRRRDAC